MNILHSARLADVGWYRHELVRGRAHCSVLAEWRSVVRGSDQGTEVREALVSGGCHGRSSASLTPRDSAHAAAMQDGSTSIEYS